MTDQCSAKPLESAKRLRSSILDYLYILLFVPVTLVVWKLPVYAFDARLVPAFLRAEADAFGGSELDFRFPLELAFPWRPEPISSLACGVMVVLSPLLVAGVFQIRLRSVGDFHAATSGALKAVVTT